MKENNIKKYGFDKLKDVPAEIMKYIDPQTFFNLDNEGLKLLNTLDDNQLKAILQNLNEYLKDNTEQLVEYHKDEDEDEDDDEIETKLYNLTTFTNRNEAIENIKEFIGPDPKEYLESVNFFDSDYEYTPYFGDD